MTHLSSLILVASAAVAAAPATAYAAPAASPVTAQAPETEKPDVDGTLDRLEGVIKDLEKIAADKKAGRKHDKKLADSVNTRLASLNGELQALTSASLTSAQEQRANNLLQRLYALLSQAAPE